jgi:hypothetical protein
LLDEKIHASCSCWEGLRSVWHFADVCELYARGSSSRKGESSSQINILNPFVLEEAANCFRGASFLRDHLKQVSGIATLFSNLLELLYSGPLLLAPLTSTLVGQLRLHPKCVSQNVSLHKTCPKVHPRTTKCTHERKMVKVPGAPTCHSR